MGVRHTARPSLTRLSFSMIAPRRLFLNTVFQHARATLPAASLLLRRHLTAKDADHAPMDATLRQKYLVCLNFIPTSSCAKVKLFDIDQLLEHFHNDKIDCLIRASRRVFCCRPGDRASHAQATRTWVSGVGDDANPCSRTAPCKTFAGAISKTATNGEIDVLDPGGFGAMTITKSITIDGGDGQIASVLVTGTPGITVDGAGAVVHPKEACGRTSLLQCRLSGHYSG